MLNCAIWGSAPLGAWVLARLARPLVLKLIERMPAYNKNADPKHSQHLATPTAPKIKPQSRSSPAWRPRDGSMETAPGPPLLPKSPQ